MNLPQAHGYKTNHALFFTAPLKGWRGVWLLGGAVAKSTASSRFSRDAMVLAT
jgi:hypothetical protein